MILQLIIPAAEGLTVFRPSNFICVFCRLGISWTKYRTNRAPSRSRKPLRLAYDSLRLASRLKPAPWFLRRRRKLWRLKAAYGELANHTWWRRHLHVHCLFAHDTLLSCIVLCRNKKKMYVVYVRMALMLQDLEYVLVLFIQTFALYKPFTYLLTYLLTYDGHSTVKMQFVWLWDNFSFNVYHYLQTS